MEQATATTAAEPGEAENTLQTDDLVLGRYRPLRPLGSGGTGSVWLVRDERKDREIALKVVPCEGKAGSRAAREAKVAARLRHPRCLRALEFERDDDHIYVGYRYVDGRTVRDALRTARLDDAASIEMAAQVLDALGYAHHKGIVHRDVKPANIMLEDRPEVSALLLDFGLAQLEETESLTAADDIPGTLAYIPPERLDGEEATGAADVWAVGVILWEALAGWHPFFSASPVETAKKIMVGPPPLKQVRPDLPNELCQLVNRMLDVRAHRRPPAKRLASHLRDVLNERAKRPRPSTSMSALRERAPHAALAALFAAGMTLILPFFPASWTLAIGALTALMALWRPSAGLALALAVPILPLGNVSLGLALAYVVLAGVWFLLFVGEPRSGFLFVAGPLLVPIGAIALIPLLAARAGGPVRRAAIGVGAAFAAFGIAAVTASRLPLTGDPVPLGLGISGSDSPSAVAYALGDFSLGSPALIAAALALGAASVAVPKAMEHGPWGAAVWGSALLVTLVLLPPLAGDLKVQPFPLLVGVWLAAAVLVLSQVPRVANCWR